MYMEDLKNKVRSIWNSPLLCAVRIPIFSMIEKWFGYPLLKRQYRQKTGRILSIKNPRSFNEKVCWKKVHDRNPLMARAADKYEVRNLVKELLGEGEANNILIPLLYVTNDPETIPFENFDCEYIIKANHGSGTNIIVSDRNIDRGEIIKECKKWLRMKYGIFKHEWAYENIDVQIIIEKLIRDKDGKLPVDYKFHMFHGRCEMIQVNQGLFSDKDNRTLNMLSPEWKKLDVFWEFPPAEYINKPFQLDKMLALAEKLSKPFDYIRVDLYCVDEHIYFGELTNYPTSGMAKILPASFDFEMGEKWRIENEYWKNNNPSSNL